MNRIVVIFNAIVVTTAVVIVLGLIVNRVATESAQSQGRQGDLKPTVTNPLFDVQPTTVAVPTLAPTASPSPAPIAATPVATEIPAEPTTADAAPTALAVPTDAAAATPTAATVGQTAYTVQRGDSLASIAKRFNSSVAAILSANTIANPDSVPVGTVLLIPSQP